MAPGPVQPPGPEPEPEPEPFGKFCLVQAQPVYTVQDGYAGYGGSGILLCFSSPLPH
jgi:hypothetical protein